jgi:hypothetical protein
MDWTTGAKIFPFSTAWCVVPIQSLIEWVPRAHSPGTKRPGFEADHSSPSTADVKNDGAVPPLSRMSTWHGAN